MYLQNRSAHVRCLTPTCKNTFRCSLNLKRISVERPGRGRIRPKAWRTRTARTFERISKRGSRGWQIAEG